MVGEELKNAAVSKKVLLYQCPAGEGGDYHVMLCNAFCTILVDRNEVNDKVT